MNRCLIITILLLLSYHLFATPEIDSLKQLVQNTNTYDTIQCKQLIKLAELYCSVQLDSAQLYAEKTEQLADQIDSDHYYFEASYRQAVIAYQRGQAAKADSAFHKLINEREDRNISVPAKYYIVHAKVSMYLDKPKEALKYADKFLSTELTPQDKHKFMIVYHNLMSDVYEHLEQMNNAFEHRQQAYQIALDYSDDESIAMQSYFLARFYRIFEDYEQAQIYLLEAERRTNSAVHYSFIYNGLLENSVKRNIPKKAHYYYYKAKEMMEKSNTSNQNDELYYQRSLAFLQEQQLDSAYFYANACLEIAKKELAKASFGDAHYALGKINVAKGNFQTAIGHYEKATEAGHIRPYQVKRELAMAYAQVNQWQQAYQTLSKSNEEHDEIFDKKALLATNSKLVSNRFEMEQEHQQLINDKKAAVLKAQITQQRGILGFASLIILILGVGTYIINRSYRAKKAAIAIIGKQKEELQQANDIKSKIFYVLGHDLRGPIGNIDVLFDEILKGNISLMEFKELLPFLKQNVAGVSLTLNNILHWGLAQTKQLKLITETVNIKHEVELVKNLLFGLMQQKQINFVYNLQDNLTIEADNAKINLIIRNLVANSIKYTPPEGSIEVTAETKNDEMIISVRDTGVGMSSDVLATLFDSPMSQDGTNQEKGTGIGLNLCKQMLEEMGGRIWVESMLGKGSTFSFALPMR